MCNYCIVLGTVQKTLLEVESIGGGGCPDFAIHQRWGPSRFHQSSEGWGAQILPHTTGNYQQKKHKKN